MVLINNNVLFSDLLLIIKYYKLHYYDSNNPSKLAINL